MRSCCIRRSATGRLQTANTRCNVWIVRNSTIQEELLDMPSVAILQRRKAPATSTTKRARPPLPSRHGWEREDGAIQERSP